MPLQDIFPDFPEEEFDSSDPIPLLVVDSNPQVRRALAKVFCAFSTTIMGAPAPVDRPAAGAAPLAVAAMGFPFTRTSAALVFTQLKSNRNGTCIGSCRSLRPSVFLAPLRCARCVPLRRCVTQLQSLFLAFPCVHCALASKQFAVAESVWKQAHQRRGNQPATSRLHNARRPGGPPQQNPAPCARAPCGSHAAC